ncbi:peptide deformylase [Absicoccus intestinalis]|uniref:Peptide deformylase n=1 Tax=Absicoccus intestinalis TaxID=2926319 RepID=A0ABU4WNQ1_9FIRM|nr:peptide deformylase [Absicoccus sp. CLA-KB-P134]MDX8417044.1 peptide deformylase [Absicoccus sp. CLA-KB-P134]
MIKPIERNVFVLKQKAKPATKNDISIARDLIDILQAHSKECVGMAANMIGIPKAIIVVNVGPFLMAMFNPKIVKKITPFETEEGCLSLNGVRKTTRYQTIEVEYQDFSFHKKRQVFHGWTAQIIQHEIDHLDGILI